MSQLYHDQNINDNRLLKMETIYIDSEFSGGLSDSDMETANYRYRWGCKVVSELIAKNWNKKY